MFVFFTFATLLLIFSFLYDFIKESVLKNFFFLLLVILCISFPVVRDVTIGVDTPMYVDFLYTRNTILDWLDTGLEIGNSFIFGLISSGSLYQNYWLLFLIYAIPTNLLMLIAIKRYSVNLSCALIVYVLNTGFYFSQFNQMRQALAVSIISFSLYYLIKSNLVVFYILVFVAGIFHTSAFVFLFIPFIYNKIKKNFILINFSSFFILAIISIFLNKFISFISILGGGFSKYEIYVDYGEQGGGLKLFFASLLILVGLLFLSKVKIYEISKEMIFFIYLNLVYIYILFCVFFLGMPSLGGGRMSQYFILGQIISVPYLISQITSKYRVLVVLLYFIVSIVFYIFILNNWGGIVPFKFNDFFI